MVAGYEAYDLDDRRFGGPYDKASGELVSMPPVELRTPQWFEEHEWRINKDSIHQLRVEANVKHIFMCGVAESDGAIRSLFDSILYLDIKNDTLAQRLSGRNSNDYGQNKFELQDIMTRKKRLDEKYVSTNIVKIDANQPLDDVISNIISYVEERYAKEIR